MRVTTTMRNYIRDLVAKKVEGRLAAANEAKRKCDDDLAKAKRDVREYAESLIPAMTEKVAKFAKGRGLTFLDHQYSYNGQVCEDKNYAFCVALGDHDYAELTPNGATLPEIEKVRGEPGRINAAVDKATNGIVFSLELGKVRKAELEELIASTEVEL